MDESSDKLEEIVQRDGRYKLGAYLFVYEALKHTVDKLGKASLPKSQRHVSGRDLLYGISEHALDRFGPLARPVFEHWGIGETRDFGEIVFNLVANDMMGKTEDDCIEDFVDVFDLDEELDWKRRRAEFRGSARSSSET